MTKKVFLNFIVLIFSISVSAQLDTIPLTFGNKLIIESKTLNEKQEAWIRFPDDYENVKDSLSLLILLDGDEYFKAASDITELYEWSGRMPKTIIVGLPSTIESRWKYYTPSNVPPKKGTTQEDSLLYLNSGNFEKYANFIAKELIPELSKELNTNFISKCIFGHSNGGLGAMSFYALRPEIFDNYIVASPALLWDDYFLFEQIGNKSRTDNLYITLGTGSWDYKVSSLEKFITKLKMTNKNFSFEENNQEGHSTNGIRTLLDGLKYVYKVEKK